LASTWKKTKNLDFIFIFLAASFSEVDKGISAQINFYGSCEVFCQPFWNDKKLKYRVSLKFPPEMIQNDNCKSRVEKYLDGVTIFSDMTDVN